MRGGNKQVSVVMVTHNRAHLLERSLHCYRDQELDNDLVEYIVIDDDGSDSTAGLCEEWARELDLVYVRVRKPVGVGWRDAAAVINLGLRMSRGRIIIPTHPEIMVGRATLRRLLDAVRERLWVAAKAYFLTAEDQAGIDALDWRGRGPLAVRALPGFYAKPAGPEGAPERRHEETEAAERWESWQLGGMTARTWGWIGGFTELEAWGAVDLDFQRRREVLGIRTETLRHEDSLCVHQNHDGPRDTRTVRDLERAHRAVPVYRSPEEAIRDHLWPRVP